MMKKIVFLSILICLLTSFSKKEITWVAIGDSITYLNNHPEATENRITKGYMSMLVDKHPDIHYINQGYSGWTSGGIAEHFDSLGIIKADLYTVFLGTNDWFQGRPLGTLTDYTNNTGNNTVYGSFRIIVNKIRNLNASAPIIFITPMQRTDFVYQFDMKNNAFGCYRKQKDQSLSQFADAVMAICRQEHFACVDLYNKKELSIEHLVKFKRVKDPQTGKYRDYPYPDYIGIPFDPAKDEYPYPVAAVDMTYDGLHPSDKGFAVIASMLEEKMKVYNN